MGKKFILCCLIVYWNLNAAMLAAVTWGPGFYWGDTQPRWVDYAVEDTQPVLLMIKLGLSISIFALICNLIGEKKIT